MKKIVYFFFLCLLCSCSGSIKKEAKEQMEKTFKELAKDPSSVSFNDVKVMYDNDSICIIQLKFSAKNGFGAMISSDMEYVYLIDTKDSTKCARELVRKLDEKESIMTLARRDYQGKEWKKGSPVDKMTDDEKKAHFIYFNAYIATLWGGRKVNYDRDDIDNW